MIFLDLDPEVDPAHVPAAKGVGGAMHGDAAKPEERVFRGLDAGHVPVQFEKYVLRDLLGKPAIAGQAPCQREHQRLVCVNETLKTRLPVAGHRVASTLLSARERGTGCKRYVRDRNKVLAGVIA